MLTDHGQQIKPVNSLVLASLEIGRALADRNGVVFRAKGTCMYPTVRPGDVLRIESRAADDVAVGDIAVCRGQSYLFGHRVIDKGEREGRVFIVTRPDRASEGNDTPMFDENLLGIVIAIERNGKRAPLRPSLFSWPVRHFMSMRIALIEMAARASQAMMRAVEIAQNGSFYRIVARALFAVARPGVSFIVRLPLNDLLGDAVYRQLKPSEFSLLLTRHDRTIERWTLALHLNDARRAAAWVVCRRSVGGNYCLDNSRVRVRYRGMGLDDALIQMASSVLDHRFMATDN